MISHNSQAQQEGRQVPEAPGEALQLPRAAHGPRGRNLPRPCVSIMYFKCMCSLSINNALQHFAEADISRAHATAVAKSREKSTRLATLVRVDIEKLARKGRRLRRPQEVLSQRKPPGTFLPSEYVGTTYSEGAEIFAYPVAATALGVLQYITHLRTL